MPASQILRLPLSPCHVAPRAFPPPTQWPQLRNYAGKQRPRPHLLGLAVRAAVDAVGYDTNDQIKSALYKALEGIDRGIFGASSTKKLEIQGFVELLESKTPTPCPTHDLGKVDGCWKLVYSTISILGSKRTKLGLRDFITLGDFLQTIVAAQGKAINEIKFNARAFKMLSGHLSIVASYKIASETRVDIKFESSDIVPVQLMDLFRKNYDLLLEIFNPDGWLEITYLDESMRIGRDDKGNIFILERFKQYED